MEIKFGVNQIIFVPQTSAEAELSGVQLDQIRLECLGRAFDLLYEEMGRLSEKIFISGLHFQVGDYVAWERLSGVHRGIVESISEISTQVRNVRRDGRHGEITTFYGSGINDLKLISHKSKGDVTQ